MVLYKHTTHSSYITTKDIKGGEIMMNEINQHAKNIGINPEKIKNPRTLELVEVYKLLAAMNCKYEEVFDENCQYKKK